MRFDVDLGSGRPAPRRDAAPVRLLLLAELQGDGAGSRETAAQRAIARVDVDSLDALLARHAPSVVVGGERFEFRSFDDFHPDTLVRHERLFGRLLDLRRRLQNPATFAAAVAELDAEARTGPSTPAHTAAGQSDTDSSTLERLLGQKPARAAQPAAPDVAAAVEGLIRRIVAPHVVAAPDPQAPQLVSAVDAALSDILRSVLHDRAFQAVEATWRGIQWLVTSLEIGEDLELHVLHLTRDELRQSAAADSALHRRLIEEAGTAGGLQFAAIVGAWQLEATADDLEVLDAAGRLARAAGAPFVAGAGPSLVGTTDLHVHGDPRTWSALSTELEARWMAIRRAPEASHVGLALPRVLLRRPYGSKTDPIETFRFEELPPAHDTGALLWGPASLACAVVLGRLLVADEPSDEMGVLSGLPSFAYHDDEGSRWQAAGEASLSDRAIDAVLARGLMPLVAPRDSDVVRLVRLQSISDPPSPLFA
jgi:type VI secretion system ImpC/EvpB family protein